MTKGSKIVFSLILALVMLTACTDSGDIKQPSNVNGDLDFVPDDHSTAAIETTVASDNETVVTVAQTVLYDTDGIVITATGYEDGWMGPEIKFLVENNSSKNVLVTTEALSVNGYMMPYASFYAEVAAGKKANERLTLLSSSLDQAGIKTVGEMRFYINISDADNWETLATSELLTLNTSATVTEQSSDDSGSLIFDSNGIKIFCNGLKQDLIWDGTIVFYMENNSGVPITVYAENVSVNGFMENASLWSDLRDGTKIVDGLSLMDLSDLELDSIDDVKNVEFNLRIINTETWDEITTTDVISLNFE